jgi:hypothetical protein
MVYNKTMLISSPLFVSRYIYYKSEIVILTCNYDARMYLNFFRLQYYFLKFVQNFHEF